MGRGKLERILCIDDDADMRLVAKLALGKVGGIEVSTSSSGEEALRRLEAGEVAPDLILLDVVMPGMDGPSTLKGLQGLPSAADTPVIFLTARTNPKEGDELLALGAVGLITKPFDPMTLAHEVRALWDRHRG
jgi:CheY-like chemotaxis protein